MIEHNIFSHAQPNYEVEQTVRELKKESKKNLPASSSIVGPYAGTQIEREGGHGMGCVPQTPFEHTQVHFLPVGARLLSQMRLFPLLVQAHMTVACYSAWNPVLVRVWVFGLVLLSLSLPRPLGSKRRVRRVKYKALAGFNSWDTVHDDCGGRTLGVMLTHEDSSCVEKGKKGGDTRERDTHTHTQKQEKTRHHNSVA